MRLCLHCGYVRYNSRNGACPKCKNAMIQVDGRLRKVVDSLTKSEYSIAYAKCETYETSEIYTVELIIGFLLPYDKYIFQDLPAHFEFVTDKYGYQPPYSLSYLLNHTGGQISMILFECCGDPERHTSAKEELSQAIDELYAWAVDIEVNRWFIYKLSGYL